MVKMGLCLGSFFEEVEVNLHLVEKHRPALTSREERIVFARENFSAAGDV